MSTEINIDRYSSNPSGFLSKLYTQTSSSAPITATVAERSLLDGGVGSKIIPANGFQVGDKISVRRNDDANLGDYTIRTVISLTSFTIVLFI